MSRSVSCSVLAIVYEIIAELNESHLILEVYRNILNIEKLFYLYS